MEGVNEISLNEATMIKALQFWLNRDQLAIERAVVVRSVQCKDNGYGRTFIVEFEPKADVNPAK